MGCVKLIQTSASLPCVIVSLQHMLNSTFELCGGDKPSGKSYHPLPAVLHLGWSCLSAVVQRKCLPLVLLIQCKPQRFSVKLEVWHYTGGVKC